MDPVPRDMAVLTIGIVRQLTGLSLRQIRYYEELGLVSPLRSNGEQRLYSINDVARLLQIKDMMDQEYPVSQIKRVLAPPKKPVQPAVQPLPSEREPDDKDLLRGIRDQLQTRTERSWSTSIIEGQLAQFYRNKNKK
ncbi:MerR family transcriptional regulator [Effusibacillus lacus]|uniref:MerR family transcriptional regulator n=1 Tax=Effusibacillus lacus TaxID=1348429 RepID=A0A292YRL0_9BACL|nr:MerR family transcriptional regulator [Effusibacillus lacus]GAX91413.1 MerR family transcriptional regulator [Effusibacillus lacus]